MLLLMNKKIGIKFINLKKIIWVNRFYIYLEKKEEFILHLTIREQEKLLISVAADVARKRKSKGLKLNYPESMAIITDEMLEGAREGKTVEELMDYGTTILSKDDVMEGIPDMIHTVQVECTFPDGTKLVTVHEPIK